MFTRSHKAGRYRIKSKVIIQGCLGLGMGGGSLDLFWLGLGGGQLLMQKQCGGAPGRLQGLKGIAYQALSVQGPANGRALISKGEAAE